MLILKGIGTLPVGFERLLLMKILASDVTHIILLENGILMSHPI